MKHQLEKLLREAISILQADETLSKDLKDEIRIERSRDKQHGHFASNVALSLAKNARCKPRDLAAKIVATLPGSEYISRVEIAGPGFINFFMADKAFYQVIADIHEAGEAYGRSTIGNGRFVQVEFVSANPTGPLHVGHGRGAAYGAAVADLLAAAGFKVHREYYVNDAGRQMDILATSLWLRYLELCGEATKFPNNGYRGDYIVQMARSLRQIYNDKFRHPAIDVMENLPADAIDNGHADGNEGGDKEAHIDALIERTKHLLGHTSYRQVFEHGLRLILDDIRNDLQEFGVVYEEWYSEHSLHATGIVDKAIERLRAGDHLYEKDGAWWFRSSDFGDEKDRVVIRENGQYTYFTSDIAYHMNKLERGFDRVIDIWGADHHGYVPRIKAALSALGDNPDKLDVLLVQFAILYRGGKKAQMSTRSGEFVTLRELRREVGNDAARFFYVMRKCEQHMDFDLDLAKSQSTENPVYYVQYAHARICSVMHQLHEKGFVVNDDQTDNSHVLLHEEHERALMVTLSRYPETVELAALAHEPHQLAYYLRELATDFHTYYNAHQFIVTDAGLRQARLSLILAVRQVLKNGLELLGVSAPISM
jgi:arginyl-tRNA synthetase